MIINVQCLQHRLYKILFNMSFYIVVWSCLKIFPGDNYARMTVEEAITDNEQQLVRNPSLEDDKQISYYNNWCHFMVSMEMWLIQTSMLLLFFRIFTLRESRL